MSWTTETGSVEVMVTISLRARAAAKSPPRGRCRSVAALSGFTVFYSDGSLMERAQSILRAKQETEETIETVLWKSSKLPPKNEIEAQFDVSLLLHGLFFV